MSPGLSNDVYACPACGHCQPTAGRCVRCNAESLLDLREQQARIALAKEEEARKARREWRVRLIGAVLAVVVGAGLCLAVPQLVPIGLSLFGLGFVIGGGVLALIMIALANAVMPYRPRFPQLRG